MQEHQSLSEPFLEIIGKVTSPTSLQMLACIGLGSDVGRCMEYIVLNISIDLPLDMKLVDDTITLIHDKRFFEKWFSY